MFHIQTTTFCKVPLLSMWQTAQELPEPQETPPKKIGAKKRDFMHPWSQGAPSLEPHMYLSVTMHPCLTTPPPAGQPALWTSRTTAEHASHMFRHENHTEYGQHLWVPFLASRDKEPALLTLAQRFSLLTEWKHN